MLGVTLRPVENSAPLRAASQASPRQVETTRTIATWAVRQDPVAWTLAGTIGVWALTFLVLGWLRFDRFAIGGFDLGIYDQGIWLLSRFEDPFVTIRGLDLFGHHMNLALILFVPFYWLGAGPVSLLVGQIASQCAGAVAVYLLARDRLANRWLGVAMAAVLLLHPTYQFLAWEYFHPDALAVGPLLFAYWAAAALRWRMFAVAAVLAVACKEDVALAVAVLGVLIYVRGDRRIGLLTAGLSAGWFLLATRALMPSFLDGMDPFYDSFFSDFGPDAGEALKSMVTNPGQLLEIITRQDRLDYYGKMFLPLALLPFAALPTLLVGVPMLVINALTSWPYARDGTNHYSALVVASTVLATVEGIAKLGERPGLKRFLVGLVAATSFAATVSWGPSPLSSTFRKYWPLSENPRHDIREAALAFVPEGEAVSATFYFTPHLTHRKNVYEFPVPWRDDNWGIRGENLHDPGGVQWLVVDRGFRSEDSGQLLSDLLAGQFEIRFDQDGVVVAERVRSASASDRAAGVQR
jgi:uncharacterized membrane protein